MPAVRHCSAKNTTCCTVEVVNRKMVKCQVQFKVLNVKCSLAGRGMLKGMAVGAGHGPGKQGFAAGQGSVLIA